MDAVLHAQFQRVEAALGTLVDSIAAFNPSPQAAIDLVAADDELSRGLDQLACHQANHARILALRAEADALETQFKSSVSTLAALRRELFETPATTFPETSRSVPYEELLQYAKNISKHTVPPTYRERVPVFDGVAAEETNEGKEKDDGSAAAVPSNGVSTPANTTAANTDHAHEAPEGEADVPKDITAEEAEWLKKLRENQWSWYPWPDNDKIRRGNLMQIQYLLDTGKNPDRIDISSLSKDEREKMEMHTQQKAVEPQVKRESVAPQVPVPRVQPASDEAPAQFTGFDFADDE